MSESREISLKVQYLTPESTIHQNGYLTNAQQLQWCFFDSVEQANIIVANIEGNLLNENLGSISEQLQSTKELIMLNLQNASSVQNQLISEYIRPWKHDQQKMLNEINESNRSFKTSLLSSRLDVLQPWCKALESLELKSYLHYKKAAQILGTYIPPIGNDASAFPDTRPILCLMQNAKFQFGELLKALWKECVVLEEQPPQVYRTNKKHLFDVKLSLLVGKVPPQIDVKMVREIRPQVLSAKDENGIIIGDIKTKEIKTETNKRISYQFKGMSLEIYDRKGRSGGVHRNPSGERVMEKKMCLQFSYSFNIDDDLLIEISTNSLPFVASSHWSQDSRADGPISWDYEFGEIDRVPFEVPEERPVHEVMQLINKKCVQMTGLPLTNENLETLANKFFSGMIESGISISKLFRDKFGAHNFTRWDWVYAAFNLIKKTETNLSPLWKAGLVAGFIDRKIAEEILLGCEVGTFILRFSDSCKGTFTIAAHARRGVVKHALFNYQDLKTEKIAMFIKNKDCLKFLWPSYPKNDAFGKFYDKPKTGPYVGLDCDDPQPSRLSPHPPSSDNCRNVNTSRNSAQHTTVAATVVGNPQQRNAHPRCDQLSTGNGQENVLSQNAGFVQTGSPSSGSALLHLPLFRNPTYNDNDSHTLAQIVSNDSRTCVVTETGDSGSPTPMEVEIFSSISQFGIDADVDGNLVVHNHYFEGPSASYSR